MTSEKAKTIRLPKPTPDQQAYLDDILANQKASEEAARNCTCLHGGSGYLESRRKCPVHMDVDMPKFCAELASTDPANLRAASARGLRYNPRKQAYVDAEGSKVRDRFGQLY